MAQLEIKYPWEIVSEVQNKTFSVEAAFSLNEGDRPLQVFNGFSRYILCVIEEGKAATCNVPVKLMKSIEMKTQKAFEKHMDFEWSPKTEGGNTPAYTVRFFAGDLKGKSPVEVLLDPDGKIKLENQKKYLEENLAKYPKNKTLIDAIDEALTMDGKNLATTTVAPDPMTILEIGTRPLKSKIREDGMWFCYEVKIVWTPSNKYPISIEITNYYAPVEKDENNLLNVQLKKKDKSSEIVNTFRMVVDDWLDVVDKMVSEKNEFIRIHKEDAYSRALEASEANRKKGSKKKQQVPNAENKQEEPEKEPVKLIKMRVVSKTPCRERRTAPGDFAMEVKLFDTEEKKNVVFKASEIKKMPEKTWNAILERSENTEVPLDFTANFEETKEGNITVYIFNSFAQ